MLERKGGKGEEKIDRMEEKELRSIQDMSRILLRSFFSSLRCTVGYNG